jgi:hypothetical protein
MGKKVLQSDGRYCYTENCRVHNRVLNVLQKVPVKAYPHKNEFQGITAVRKRTKSKEVLLTESRDVLKQLTKNELIALKLYSGNLFDDVNRFLEKEQNFHSEDTDGNETIENISPLTSRKQNVNKIKRVVKELDSAIAKSKLKEKYVVYRGVSNYVLQQSGAKTTEEFVRKLKQDKTYTSNAYMSTSNNPTIAYDYSNDTGIIMEILPSSSINLSSSSFFEDEEEVLLPRNSTYRIVNVYKPKLYEWEHHTRTASSKDITVIQLEQIS